jgi:hypothetical protein
MSASTRIAAERDIVRNHYGQLEPHLTFLRLNRCEHMRLAQNNLTPAFQMRAVAVYVCGHGPGELYWYWVVRIEGTPLICQGPWDDAVSYIGFELPHTPRAGFPGEGP